MSHDNAGQVLLQVQESLRHASLRSNESGLLAFQLLVWSHLSIKGKLEVDIRPDAVLAYGASGIVDSLSRLAMVEGTLGQAFGDASRLAQFAGDYIVSALVSAKRLAEGGIFERFSPTEIAGDLMQSSLGDMRVPAELATLMVELTVRGREASVYCPWESSGLFIGALMRERVSLYAETPNVSALPALLSLFREAPTTLVLANPLRSPTAIKGGHLEKFDAALSFPPMGTQVGEDVAWQDLYGRFPIKKATATGLMVQHILAQTDGSAAIIVPNSFLFGPGKDREVREYLLKNGWIEAVIALPSGLYQTTNLPTALLLLNTRGKHQQIGFIDASQAHFRKAIGKGRVTLDNTSDITTFCRSLHDGDSLAGSVLGRALAVVVPSDEVFDKESSLQVDRYVMGKEQRDVQARLAAMPTVLLEDIAEIHNPVPNKDRNPDTITAIEVHEIGAADLPEAGYVVSPRKKDPIRVQLSNRRSGSADDVFLRAGDVLLITKGSVGKVGIVPADVPAGGAGGWVAGQSAVVLRGRAPHEDLRGLGLWLRSKMGKDVLAGITSGATIPMISIQTLRRLQVPSISHEAALRAAQVLDQEAEIQRSIEALKTEQVGLSEQLWNELLN